jgi:hypothetical protein
MLGVEHGLLASAFLDVMRELVGRARDGDGMLFDSKFGPLYAPRAFDSLDRLLTLALLRNLARLRDGLE